MTASVVFCRNRASEGVPFLVKPALKGIKKASEKFSEADFNGGR